MKLATPIRSSAIAAIEYDTDTLTLTVEFTNGRSYTHVAVPPEVVDGLRDASSPGAYYNAAIKGQY